MSSVGTVASFDALGFDPAPGDLAQLSTAAQICRALATALLAATGPLALPMALTANALSRWETALGELKHRARVLELDARQAQDNARPIDRTGANSLRERHRVLVEQVTAELAVAAELARIYSASLPR
ncbi:hypothetical protein [Amycolatopsis sp. H20-H5]|uniref:hypothetical protein n=1 Tax=Amycolatopsis sp. H20-H5 TaxID=3046309 RepID=UPI002DBC7382|nr:hypothetical protein [Amycolatopsis sp. H20-H5]MEC3981158.1 hypothetical protein [Amycolatopsis sp. H20-H5]